MRLVWASVPVLSIKWEKGKCERGVRKRALNEGFLGEMDFREKLVWKFLKLITFQVFVPPLPLESCHVPAHYWNSSLKTTTLWCMVLITRNHISNTQTSVCHGVFHRTVVEGYAPEKHLPSNGG